MANPEQQGLKRNFVLDLGLGNNVEMANPEQQGLKLVCRRGFDADETRRNG